MKKAIPQGHIAAVSSTPTHSFYRGMIRSNRPTTPKDLVGGTNAGSTCVVSLALIPGIVWPGESYQQTCVHHHATESNKTKATVSPRKHCTECNTHVYCKDAEQCAKLLEPPGTRLQVNWHKNWVYNMTLTMFARQHPETPSLQSSLHFPQRHKHLLPQLLGHALKLIATHFAAVHFLEIMVKVPNLREETVVAWIRSTPGPLHHQHHQHHHQHDDHHTSTTTVSCNRYPQPTTCNPNNNSNSNSYSNSTSSSGTKHRLDGTWLHAPQLVCTTPWARELGDRTTPKRLALLATFPLSLWKPREMDNVAA